MKQLFVWVTVTILLAAPCFSATTTATTAIVTQLDPQFATASQLTPADLPALKAQGVNVVIDMRPDGEAADQPTSTQMQQAAAQQGMAFFYIPIAHGAISASSVDMLQQVLANKPGKITAYCRSGKRASRSYALALASMKEGPTQASINAILQGAGQNIDDLQDEIAKRIAAR